MLDTRGLLKLGRLSGEELSLSSLWGSLTEKLADSGRMDLSEVMATDAKRATIPNNFGMPLLYFISLIVFLCLNPEVRRFS